MAKKRFLKSATQKIKVAPKTNSGKLVYEILGKKEKPSNLSDFSNFPTNAEKINNVCLEQIVSCGFNNVASAYYSRTQLNEDFGYSDISLLAGKYITYAIVLDNGKWYFGSTSDFGERIHTWLKDFRGHEMSKERERVREIPVNEQLCGDVRKYKRALFMCLGISKTLAEAKRKENELIVNFVFERFKEITNGEDPTQYSWKDIMCYTKRYVYNKVRAIANV